MLRAPKLNGRHVLEQARSPSATYDIANRHSKHGAWRAKLHLHPRGPARQHVSCHKLHCGNEGRWTRTISVATSDLLRPQCSEFCDSGALRADFVATNRSAAATS